MEVVHYFLSSNTHIKGALASDIERPIFGMPIKSGSIYVISSLVCNTYYCLPLFRVLNVILYWDKKYFQHWETKYKRLVRRWLPRLDFHRIMSDLSSTTYDVARRIEMHLKVGSCWNSKNGRLFLSLKINIYLKFEQRNHGR